MVDYSKWDKLEDSDDEEQLTGPSVYRVGKGASVTIPGRNVTIHSRPQATLSSVSKETGIKRWKTI